MLTSFFKKLMFESTQRVLIQLITSTRYLFVIGNTYGLLYNIAEDCERKYLWETPKKWLNHWKK